MADYTGPIIATLLLILAAVVVVIASNYEDKRAKDRARIEEEQAEHLRKLEVQRRTTEAARKAQEQTRAKAEWEAKLQAEFDRNYTLEMKYVDPEIVDRIIRKVIWIGETSDMLLDSLGNPDDTDTKIMKTKIKEVWKYFPQGRGRYGLKINIDNGIVIGWDEKMPPGFITFHKLDGQ